MADKKLNGTVIVTYRCNARCSMCSRFKAPSRAEEEISIETIKKLPKNGSFTFSHLQLFEKALLDRFFLFRFQ